MVVKEYEKARKLGLKEVRKHTNCGKYPYLPVLDDLLEHVDIIKEQNLGLVEIPLNQIMGTKSRGRTNAFSSNFMPVLENDTEFAIKWMNLYQSHLNEGIRDPIQAYEFMNCFYIQEGNKRVSVMKYFHADSILGNVIRLVPKKDGTKQSEIYYEFLEFYRLTNINYVNFSEPGCYQVLLKHVDSSMDIWTLEKRKDFKACFDRFSIIFEEQKLNRYSLTNADAFLIYLDYYGYENILTKTQKELKNEILKLQEDFDCFPDHRKVNLKMNADSFKSGGVIRNNLKLSIAKLKIAFLYEKTPQTSKWTYSHDLGRQAISQEYGSRVETYPYYNIQTSFDGINAMEEAIHKGCTLIFTTTPRMLNACMSISVKYPNIKILNCSLNTCYGHIKTYYGRLYEVKFLLGIIAGIIDHSGRIGYLADYPIYGSIANINAFALGVQMVNPEAKVYLHWFTEKEKNAEMELKADQISVVSGYDSMIPNSDHIRFGLYDFHHQEEGPVALTLWNWQIFYSKVIQSILNNTWKKEKLKPGEAINYWWGMNAGVIDILLSSRLPYGIRHLVESLKGSIQNRILYPFSGEIYAQDHILKNRDGNKMTAQDIMTMDWLADNVVGNIPLKKELTGEAKILLEVQGIRKEDRSRL